MQISESIPFSHDWETLKKLSLPFSFALDQDYLSAQEMCCKAILKACRLEQWTLIEAHAEIIAKVRDAFGKTILMQAIYHSSSVIQLINYKIAIHAKDSHGNNACHHAVMNGAIDSLPFLLNHLSIQERNIQEETALHLAIKTGQEAIVKQLLEQGANIKAPLPFEGISLTPPLYAVMRGERKCVSVLLNQQTLHDETKEIGNLLHVAAYFHQSEMIEFLLSGRFENLKIDKFIDKKNRQGQTPLSLAAAQGNLVAVELLFQKGASLETEDNHKMRPIHHAAFAKEHAMVQLLAALGSRLAVVDADGHFPSYFVEHDSSSDGQSMKNLLNNLMQQNEESRIYMPLPENISFKGDATVYPGVLQTFREKNIPIKRVTGHGTSALFAALFSLGFNDQELKQALQERENQFDPSNSSQDLQELKVIHQLLLSERSLESPLVNKTGFCLGEKLRLWIEDLLFKKTGIQFFTFGELKSLVGKDLPYKHLLLFAADVKSKGIVRFDSEDPSCTKIIVSDVLRIALGTPFLFSPHPLHIKEGEIRIKQGEQCYIQLSGKQFPSAEAYDHRRYQTGGIDFPCYHKKTIGFEIVSFSRNQADPETVPELLNALVAAYEFPQNHLSTFQEPRTIAIEGNESASFAAEHYLQIRLSQFARYETLPTLIKSLTGRIQLPPSLPPEAFAGREDFLEKLHALSFPKNWSCDLQTPLLLLHGPGGIGKTELAITFGNRCIKEFSIIKFITCENQFSYEQHYRELADTLRIPTEKKSPDEIISGVHHTLERMKAEGKPWLLIFDNVEKEIPFPMRGGIVLMTGQRTELFRSCRLHLLQLTPLTESEAKMLFADISSLEISELNKALEGIPGLLTLAQRYIQETHFTVQEYLKELDQKKQDHPLRFQEECYKRSFTGLF